MLNYNLKDVRDYFVKVHRLLKRWKINVRTHQKIRQLMEGVLDAVCKENGFKSRDEAAGKIPIGTKLEDKSLTGFNKLKEFIKAEELKHRN